MKERKQDNDAKKNVQHNQKDGNKGGEFVNPTTNQGGNRETDSDTFVAGRSATDRAAGMSTKKGVTGSDLDGQVSS